MPNSYVLTTYDPDDESRTTERHLNLEAFKDPADVDMFEDMVLHGQILEERGNKTYAIKHLDDTPPPAIPPFLPPGSTTFKDRLTEKYPPFKVPVVPGTKFDADKPRPTLLIMSLANAVLATTEVLTFGAKKYSDDGWHLVPDGIKRYTDAMYRHLLAEGAGEEHDPETGLLHAAHTAADALIRLELLLRERT